MAMSQMMKWQKSNERNKKANTKKKLRDQDIQDLKDRDLWEDPRERFLDEYGHVLPNAPAWWLNLRKAWITNDQQAVKRNANKDLSEAQPKRRRKKKPLSERKPTIKHSEKMRAELKDHGVYIDVNGMLSDEFSNFRFCVNGKLLDTSKPNSNTISVFYFLQHYADT